MISHCALASPFSIILRLCMQHALLQAAQSCADPRFELRRDAASHSVLLRIADAYPTAAAEQICQLANDVCSDWLPELRATLWVRVQGEPFDLRDVTGRFNDYARVRHVAAGAGAAARLAHSPVGHGGHSSPDPQVEGPEALSHPRQRCSGARRGWWSCCWWRCGDGCRGHRRDDCAHR